MIRNFTGVLSWGDTFSEARSSMEPGFSADCAASSCVSGCTALSAMLRGKTCSSLISVLPGNFLEAEAATGWLLGGESNASLSGEELVPQVDKARLSSECRLGE